MEIYETEEEIRDGGEVVIHVICGMIGAGKSTYAQKHYKHVLEFESFGSKDLQILAAKKLHKQGNTVAYITCYPNMAERLFFDSLKAGEVRYILINTSFQQCAENIIKRGRAHDYQTISSGFEPNRKYEEQYASTDIPFKRINVFESKQTDATKERW